MIVAALKTLGKPFLKDRLLHVLLLVGVILTVFRLSLVKEFASFVDWTTIITLLGLMLLTKGVEVSGYFDFIGRRILNGLRSERKLALFLVSAAALLSTFLTNDVALFIVIPLTMTLKKLSSLPVTRLIIFEALAVNAGSLLTPIGNPQNILLWSKSGLSFMAFIAQMTPLMLAMVATLLLVTWLSFPAQEIQKKADTQGYPYQKRLLIGCVALYILFIACVDLGVAIYGLLAVFVGFLIVERRVLMHIDWSLIFVFIVMFIDVRLIVTLAPLQPLFAEIAHLSPPGIFALGIGLSQIISNVPATILMMNYLPSSALIAYAVNIGGYGLALGSLANLIALRMANDRRIWLKFHYYSLPFLAWGALVGWLLLSL